MDAIDAVEQLDKVLRQPMIRPRRVPRGERIRGSCSPPTMARTERSEVSASGGPGAHQVRAPWLSAQMPPTGADWGFWE
jgi:hypothetical protein